VAPVVHPVTTPGFPPQYKAEADKGAAFLDLPGQEKGLSWTFLSPSALFVTGKRTAKFHLGSDQLLTATDGKNWISFEDFAVALADENKRPAHVRKRFTVGQLTGPSPSGRR
jgi:putative NADH-flavin reductase